MASESSEKVVEGVTQVSVSAKRLIFSVSARSDSAVICKGLVRDLILRVQSLKLVEEGPGLSSTSPERRIRNSIEKDLGVRRLWGERRKYESGILERLPYWQVLVR